MGPEDDLGRNPGLVYLFEGLARSRNSKERPLIVVSNSKIKSISELGPLLARLRADRASKIVQCHGVFDLLHVGHIRHFAEARKMGDVLVVTITPDCHVNKGPHRPAFNQGLRAESIAALECVDYVAVNEWPTAVEAIGIVRPDYYVKGPDYKDASKDVTQGILLEQRAVESVGGSLVHTDDLTFSSSQLLSRHFPSFAPEVQKYLREFGERHRPQEILGYLDSVRTLRVLVVGEAIIDEYQYCQAIGKSSKEPMLAVRRLDTEKFAGGILAVGNHTSSFCDQVGLVTLLGERDSQESFIREKLNPQIETTFITHSGAPTLVKRRFIENYFFTKMLEVYEMDDRELSGVDQERLCAALFEQLPKYDVTIVVDFGHGMLNREAIRIIEDRARFLAINVQSNAANLGYHAISKYGRADYVCCTEPELRLEARDRHSEIEAHMVQVCQRMGATQVTATRGRNGSLVYSARDGFVSAPALAGQVVDRVGAGDAVLSVTAMCVARQVPAEVTAFIGNAVGAQAVATVGNRTPLQRPALYKHIESLLK